MQSKQAIIGFSLAVALCTWTESAGAVCTQSESMADRQLWDVHGCYSAYFLWHYKAYDTNKEDWDPRGYGDACNANKEYAKHWNAAYLISWGLAEDPAQNFHSGLIDYQPLVEARTSDEWHDGLRHQVTDDTAIYGKWMHRSGVVNLLLTSCTLYDPAAPLANANPGSRGGDFVHEGTHAWSDRHGYSSQHYGMSGACSVINDSCDFFYFHGLSAFALGAMWYQDGTAAHYHSPTQSQVEFLCDISDFPAAWVPASVRIAAGSDATQRSARRFINGPGYSCGTARPW